MSNKFVIFILIIAGLIGVFGYQYWQKNIYSKEIIKLEILGPEEVNLGEEVEYIVKYKNNGKVRVEEPKLIFEYPTYSILAEEGFLRKEIGQEVLGEAIYPGEEKVLHFKARLLGKENESKIAKAWLSYRPKNLRGRNESATSFTTLIKKIPLTFEFDLPSKIKSGREFEFYLNYFSNVNYPLSDLQIKINWPSGFELKETKPTVSEENEWEISLLNRGEGGRIEISGIVWGKVGEQRIFEGGLGIWRAGEFVLLKEVIKGVEIMQPSLYISQQINGSPQYRASPGALLHYEIFFRNIGEEALENLVLVTRLEGELFDFETLKSDLGNFEPGDNSILWDWKEVSKLRFLSSQEEGRVEFWIELKEESEKEIENPVLKNKIYLSQAREEFTTKVNSKLEVSQKGYFRDEVFGNSGPIPPKEGEATTYTIIWQAKNYWNEVKNVKVKTTLPKGVELTSKVFPETAVDKLAFDSVSREIVWEVGDLKIREGVLELGPNIAFQISFTPDDSQKGTTPTIIGQAKITGEDQWTETTIEGTSPAIDTTLADDETITEEMGTVQ